MINIQYLFLFKKISLKIQGELLRLPQELRSNSLVKSHFSIKVNTNRIITQLILCQLR